MTRICREAEASLDYYAMFKNILKQVGVLLVNFTVYVSRSCRGVTEVTTPCSRTSSSRWG